MGPPQWPWQLRRTTARPNAALRGPKTGTRAEEVEEHETTDDVPRRQGPPPLGQWPAPLLEVAGPQGTAVMVGYVAAVGPLLALPRLARSGGPPDADSLRFLEESKGPGFKERMQRINRNFTAGALLALGELAAWQRWAGLDTSSGQKEKRRGERGRRRGGTRLSRAVRSRESGYSTRPLFLAVRVLCLGVAGDFCLCSTVSLRSRLNATPQVLLAVRWTTTPRILVTTAVWVQRTRLGCAEVSFLYHLGENDCRYRSFVFELIKTSIFEV